MRSRTRAETASTSPGALAADNIAARNSAAVSCGTASSIETARSTSSHAFVPSTAPAKPGGSLNPTEPLSPSLFVATHRVDGPETTSWPSRTIRSVHPSAGTVESRLPRDCHRVKPCGKRISTYIVHSHTPRSGIDAVSQSPEVSGFPWWVILVSAVLLLVAYWFWRAGHPQGALCHGRPRKRELRSGSDPEG